MPSHGCVFTIKGLYDIMPINYGIIPDRPSQRRSIMTDVNDIVLIYIEDKPQAFARVEAIEPDVKRGWYHVKLLLLQVPLIVVTWILRDVYIEGETFTMEGKPMRLERVKSPESREKPTGQSEKEVGGEKGKVISLADLKKK